MPGGVKVVNCQVFATASGFPARSLAAVETARRVLRPRRQVGVGLEEKTPGPYQPKMPLTGAPSLVRFSEKAAWAEDLSIALSKGDDRSSLLHLGRALGRADAGDARGAGRRVLPGLRDRQRVPGEVLGGGRDGRRVLRPRRQVGVGLEEEHARAVPAEDAAHRGPVAGPLQREGGLGGRLVHGLVEAGDRQRTERDLARAVGRRDAGDARGGQGREPPASSRPPAGSRRGPWRRSKRSPCIASPVPGRRRA